LDALLRIGECLIPRVVDELRRLLCQVCQVFSKLRHIRTNILKGRCGVILRGRHAFAPLDFMNWVSPITQIRYNGSKLGYPGNSGSSADPLWFTTVRPTISIGAARKPPTGPHSQVQNTSATNTAGGLNVKR